MSYRQQAGTSELRNRRNSPALLPQTLANFNPTLRSSIPESSTKTKILIMGEQTIEHTHYSETEKVLPATAASSKRQHTASVIRELLEQRRKAPSPMDFFTKQTDHLPKVKLTSKGKSRAAAITLNNPAYQTAFIPKDVKTD